MKTILIFFFNVLKKKEMDKYMAMKVDQLWWQVALANAQYAQITDLAPKWSKIGTKLCSTVMANLFTKSQRLNVKSVIRNLRASHH